MYWVQVERLLIPGLRPPSNHGTFDRVDGLEGENPLARQEVLWVSFAGMHFALYTLAKLFMVPAQLVGKWFHLTRGGGGGIKLNLCGLIVSRFLYFCKLSLFSLDEGCRDH